MQEQEKYSRTCLLPSRHIRAEEKDGWIDKRAGLAQKKGSSTRVTEDGAGRCVVDSEENPYRWPGCLQGTELGGIQTQGTVCVKAWELTCMWQVSG